MKRNKIFTIALTVFAAVFTSCISENVGPPGPPGPAGPTGPQGAAGESGFVFEYENVTFTSPDYEVFINYPEDFEGLDSDVTLVYFLWDVQTDGNGNPMDVWRQLPQTIVTEFGLLLYNFDHTKFDVRLFMDAAFDLDVLGAIDTDDWVVRVVVIPASFWGSRMAVDLSDYYSVKEVFGLPDLGSHKITYTRR